MISISTLFDAEPALKLHLVMAAKSAQDARLVGDAELYAECIDEIDGITDRLADRGLCRERNSHTRLSAERARLKYRGKA